MCRSIVAVVSLSLFFCAIQISFDARADDVDSIDNKVKEIADKASLLRTHYLKSEAQKGDRFVEGRMIDGEKLYQIGDYENASIIFMDIVENYPNHGSYFNALFLYADSLFKQEDYSGARQWFAKLVDSSQGLPQSIRAKALERLIEIAIHLEQYEGVDRYVRELQSVPDQEASYIRGKYFYYKGELDQAQREFGTIVGETLLTYKALYMTGVVLTLKEKYQEAINVFLRGQQIQSKSKEEQEIIDLMNLGAGRLYFEQGFVQHATQCYEKIEQNSPYFDAALYESASVLVRAGYTRRAEQMLEILTVALPNSKYIPRAKMLRGNLLLRTGRYNEAEKVFDELIEEFTPVMTQLDELTDGQGSTRQFFFDLVERSKSSLDASTVLPPLVVKWVGEEPEVSRALNVADNLGKAKIYVKETQRLVRLLEAVIDGPSRVNAIPILREAVRRAQQLENRLSLFRTRLSRLARNEFGEKIAGLNGLGNESDAIASQLEGLPTDDISYKNREEESKEVYIRMRKELARNVVRLDQLSAMIVAIDRFINDPRYTEGVAESDYTAMQNELSNQRKAVDQMQEELVAIRTDVERGSLQFGVGDVADKKDDELKQRLRSVSDK